MSRFSLRSSQAEHAHMAAIFEYATRVRAIRRSKIAFWAVGITTATATTVIASVITTPLRAAFIGVLAGAVLGFLVALGLFIWPAVRVLWHWAFEIALLIAVLAGYLLLTSVWPWPVALAVLTSAMGGPFALPSLRRSLWAWVMCAVIRHRLRVCFAAFIASLRTGLTPLILLARPIPAGERVWIWLRPGLALADLEQRMDRLAAGCWATEARISPGSRRYSALLRLDIARRNPLAGHISSPLPGLVPGRPLAATVGQPLQPLGGLDLPDTPAPAVEPKRRPKAVTANPEPPAASTDPDPPDPDDLSAWI